MSARAPCKHEIQRHRTCGTADTSLVERVDRLESLDLVERRRISRACVDLPASSSSSLRAAVVAVVLGSTGLVGCRGMVGGTGACSTAPRWITASADLAPDSREVFATLRRRLDFDLFESFALRAVQPPKNGGSYRQVSPTVMRMRRLHEATMTRVVCNSTRRLICDVLCGKELVPCRRSRGKLLLAQCPV